MAHKERFQPNKRNVEHFSTENFPQVVGFCERGEGSYTLANGVQSYDYKLSGRTVYRLTKKTDGSWRMLELDENENILAHSFGKNLGITLFHGLHNGVEQEGFTYMKVVAPKEKEQEILALMYHLGGYPGSKSGPEDLFLQEHDPRFADTKTLTFQKIPVEAMSYLQIELNPLIYG